MEVQLSEVVKAYQQIEQWLRAGELVELGWNRASHQVVVTLGAGKSYVQRRAESLAKAVLSVAECDPPVAS